MILQTPHPTGGFICLTYNLGVFIFSALFSLLVLFLCPNYVLAVSDPLSVPNNPLGLHLLFPEELPQAAQIVNDHGRGAWGYVVVPIQATDRNRDKWQKFFDNCLTNKIIPIIRVATVVESSSWVTPNHFDIIDFANFLDDLVWPVQNRYLIIYNEVNRADEYGGLVSPESYADILTQAIKIFKQKSPDYFILPSAMDNSASDRKSSIPWQEYWWRMYRHQPEIFNQIDGWNSHAYPNPDFSARPDLSGSTKIDSYKYDLKLLQNFTSRQLPIFITEAGWSDRYLSAQQISLYYRYAFSKVWSDPQIVTVAPFLLNAQDGPFKPFSFLDQNQQPKEFVAEFSSKARVGEPPLATSAATPQASEVASATTSAVLGIQTNYATLIQRLYNSLKSLLNLFR